MSKDIYNEIEWFELNAIELLGYAKNNLAEAKEKAISMPREYKEKLSCAYSMLHEVQEYLFNH